MIRKLVRQMLTAQIFSALTVSLCLLIDNIMIGRYLGVQALAAYSVANPILLALGALGSMLSAGIQVVGSRSLARGDKADTDAGYSSAIMLTVCISGLFMLAVLLFRSPLATALGAGNAGGDLHGMASEYMAGFIIGAPASMGALVLMPFLQMAGQSNLLIVAVLAMTIGDVALDLLNVLVFHGGMFGMGLASSLSYYIALAIAAVYFLSRKCVFRFSLKSITLKKIRELFVSGVPAVFGMASSVILVFAMNQLLRSIEGETAMGAYTVITSLGNASNCITTGIGGVSLTLAGMLFTEEDRNGLQGLIRQLCRYSVILGLCVGTALMVFAPPLVGLFIPQHGDARQMAILGLRLFAVGLVPCCINAALKNHYQATGRVFLTEVFSVVESLIMQIMAAFALSRFMGLTGAWLFFSVGEWLTLFCLGIYINRMRRTLPWHNDAFLLMKPDFGVSADQLLELDLHSMEEVAQAAQTAERFCVDHGQSPRISNHIALCIEEMASNTIRHGFEMDRRAHHLSVRLLHKQDQWVLRFRDDCGAFDPVHYVPAEGEEALGIRLVLAMSNEATYTYSMNMNNLTLRFRGE